MKFKPGDQVSFLSEKRDGIVRKILKDGLVSVEIEDGFEIPVMPKELIKIGTDGRVDLPDDYEVPTEHHSTNTSDNIQKHEPPKYEDMPDEEEAITTALLDDKSFKKNGIYLCFEPVKDPGKDIQFYRLYLVNKTDYDVLFTCFLMENDTYKAFTYDAVAASSKYLLEEISAKDIASWAQMLFQFLFYTERKQPVKEPLSIEKRLKVSKLFKNEAFTFYPIIGFSCYLTPIFEDVVAEEWPEEAWAQEKIIEVPARDIRLLLEPKIHVEKIDPKHVTSPYIAEVDLHIEQLYERAAELNNHDKLKLQIDYFTKTLDAAIAHKFKKITYIHGVGQGILKENIAHIINESYKGIKIQDAPLRKYGMGATEVIIPFNLVY